MDRTVFDQYLRLDEVHFWRVGKRKLVMEWLQNNLPNPCRSILDVGGAASLLTKELSQLGTVTVVEPDKKMVELASSNARVQVISGQFPGLPVSDRCDVVTLLDVLEHIEDDRAALEELLSLLNPRGLLVITVPAYMWLWTDHDVILHHKRRYTLTQLESLLNEVGFRVTRSSYYTSLLFPLMAASRLANRVRFGRGKKNKPEYAPRNPSALVNRILVAVMSMERKILRFVRLPFGGSMIVLCTPKTNIDN
ncbi:MAG: class I SAM-dependent methyltransferase [Halioglobus sp.]|nr:class I SAM-dependent methyltransferase [Halioglobus sp.]